MKQFNTRISQKHDIEANWQQAVSFIPMQGELIIYDPDDNYSYPRMKLGDGNTLVNDLPFLYEDRLDRFYDNVNKTNLLAYHNPNCVDVEYTNNNGGWKIDLRDENDNVIPHTGANMFSQPHTNQREHTVEFFADGLTKANLSIYSMTSHPGEFLISDMELVTTKIDNPAVFNNHIIYDSNDNSWNEWQPNWNYTVAEQRAQANIDGSWGGLFYRPFQVASGAICHLTLDIGDIITQKNNTGAGTGVNFSIKDGNGANIRDINDIEISSYFRANKHGNQIYTYTFIAPTSTISVNFSGPGNSNTGTITFNQIALKYIDRFVEDAEGTAPGGEWQTGDNSWYRPSYKTDEKHSGTKSLRLKADKGYWGYMERKASLIPNIPYRYKFWVKGVDGLCTFSIVTRNGTELCKESIYASATSDWTLYDYRIMVPQEDRTINIKFQLNSTYDTNLFYFDDMELIPLEYTSSLLNGNFAELISNPANEAEPRARYWDFTNSQSYVEDSAVRLKAVANKQYSMGLNQTILLHPDGHYKLTFKTQRISRSYVWKPYSTMMPEDKIALVTGQPGYVPARIQSPWGAEFSPDHQMRVTISGDPTPQQWTGFFKALEFTAEITSTDTFYVQVETSFDNNQTYIVDNTYSFTSLGAIQNYIIPFEKGFAPEGDKDVNICSNIRLTFFTQDNNNGAANPDTIYHIFAYGDKITTPEYVSPKEFRADANGNILFRNKITTPQLIATTDDGNLDF